MSKTHLIADENLGGIKREYVEVEREADVGDYVLITRINHDDAYEIRKVTRVFCECDQFEFAPNIKFEDTVDYELGDEYRTLEPTDIVHVEGQRYRLVERKASVGEKVLVTGGDSEGFKIGDVFTVTETEFYFPAVGNIYNDNVVEGHYAVIELVAEPAELTELTESDVRNNPRQVIDLIGNLALRVTELEQDRDKQAKKIESITRDLGWHEMGPGRIANLRNSVSELKCDVCRIDAKIEDEKHLSDEWAEDVDVRVSRLADANEQAVTIVARNVETWAQEVEAVKYGQDELYQRLGHVEADLDEIPEGAITSTCEEDFPEYKEFIGDSSEGFDVVQKPAHYNNGKYEVIDVIEDSLRDIPNGFEAYCIGNVQKYIARYRHKNGVEDLRKAAWYLNRAIESKDDTPTN
jgi:archaellum component FlaC